MANLGAPTNLRCEYLVNPIGIDVQQPRLSWLVNDERRGARQTAHQIVVSLHSGKMGVEIPPLWDSGKVAGDRSIHVPYAGPVLKSRQRYFWKIRTWDVNDQPSDWSQQAFWETGLLDPSEWQAHWIGSEMAGGQNTTSPCPYLRKGFHLDKPVARARLYITALGLYECFINGRAVGDGVFRPGWTDYDKRLQYQVYDVTGLLNEGQNTIGAILGDGWYCGFVGYTGRRQTWGDRPKLLAQLMVDFHDESSAFVRTDGSWKTSAGPLLESDMLMGESYDARLEIPDWNMPGFDDSSWRQVRWFDPPAARLVASCSQPVRRVNEIRPAKPVKHWHNWIVDMGQNMVGRVRLKVSGPAGTTVTIRHVEMLNPDGSIYSANLRAAKATDHYTLKGHGEEIYEPTFTFHGFRYVELVGFPGEPTADAITGVILHSDTPVTGSFECSDKLLNQLQHNIIWGQKGNFLEVPTDCPQRDERLGWTGDAQVFIRTACHNMDVAAFFTKWQDDIADNQSRGEGQISMVIPDPARQAGDGGPAWADAAIICPWTIYQRYGDARLLERHYDSLKKFTDDLHQRKSRDFIRAYDGYDWCGFGDWLAMDGSDNRFGGTPKDLIGTAFLAYSTRLMERIARALGRGGDAAKYEGLFQNVRRAFINRFVTPAGLVAAMTQTAYVLALHFDLLPEELRPAAVEELVKDIRKRGNHLSCGFVGSSYLNPVLSRFGKPDVAYDLLSQKTWPSWLYAVTQGATTIWERWDGWTHDKGFQNPGMNSFNHYAYGAIGAWLYSTVAGIDADPDRPGYKHIIIHPRPGGELNYAKASLMSMHGLIESCWWLEGQMIGLRVKIPPNATATVHVPTVDAASVSESDRPADQAEAVRPAGFRDGAAIFEVGAGQYTFKARRS
ncbi:MAG: family 78 glycoside hydrolase catalytic domain [Planctomycetes bacterium]|nr:family 78 glycoside hydrolase catalytic domain [Planctomycetota bacterium]